MASEQEPAQVAGYAGVDAAGAPVLSRDEARAVFGQVMGFVAITLGFLALGAYIGRNRDGGWGILPFVGGFACVIGLNVASARRNEQLAITLLFGLGLLLGLALGPVSARICRPIRPRCGRPPGLRAASSPASAPSATRLAATVVVVPPPVLGAARR
jgi:hypothetical protein